MTTPPLPQLTPHPPVSVVLTVLNEERHLEAAVRSALDNGYPGTIEVVVAVGPSADGTATVARALAADPRVTVADNPTGLTPQGLNIAIAAAAHGVLVRIDGHTVLPDGYIDTAVAELAATGAGNVGGQMVPVGQRPMQRAVAAAMSSVWGIGGARFHVGGEPGPAESVFLGVFRREAVAAVGGFDERFSRAQDWELNFRLRAAGYVVWFDPSLQVEYHPRASLRAVARQFHASGQVAPRSDAHPRGHGVSALPRAAPAGGDARGRDRGGRRGPCRADAMAGPRAGGAGGVRGGAAGRGGGVGAEDRRGGRLVGSAGARDHARELGSRLLARNEVVSI